MCRSGGNDDASVPMIENGRLTGRAERHIGRSLRVYILTNSFLESEPIPSGTQWRIDDRPPGHALATGPPRQIPIL